MLRFLKNMFAGHKECEHKLNYVYRKYIEQDTPMVYFHCLDCDYKDRGPVFGDTYGWVETILCTNGVTTKES